MKKHIFTILFILLFLAGLGVFMYPAVSNWWNAYHSSQVMNGYTEKVAGLSKKDYKAILDRAHKYNAELAKNGNAWKLTDRQWSNYIKQLNIAGDGVMGSIVIDCIHCNIPIYHGTDSAVLQKAVGHLEGSSLPVGGENTHCVLSGHRGLPSAELFSKLDRIVVGDTFELHVLKETFTYEVDQILTVLPEEIDPLKIQKGADYCTLVTCTPYAVNTHRLLVRGHRIPNIKKDKTVEEEDQEIDRIMLIATGINFIVILILTFFVIKYRKPKEYKKREKERKKFRKIQKKLTKKMKKTIRKERRHRGKS